MRLLAKNEKAALYRCGREYWVVEANFNPCAVNEASHEYSAVDALDYFQRVYGDATWEHEFLHAY